MKTIWKLASSIGFQSLISSQFPHLWNVNWVKPSLCDQETNILYLRRAEKRPAITIHTRGKYGKYIAKVIRLGFLGGVVPCRVLLSNSTHPSECGSPKPWCCRVKTSLQSSCLLWLQRRLRLHFSDSLWGNLRVSLVSILKETFPWLWKTNLNFQNRKKLFQVKAGEAYGWT